MSINQALDQLRLELQKNSDGLVEVTESSFRELGVRSVAGRRLNGVWELTIAFDDRLIYSTGTGTFEECAARAVAKIGEASDDR